MAVTRDEWIAALESGKYKKGTGALRCGIDRDRFCCLGVLADLIRPDGWELDLWSIDGRNVMSAYINLSGFSFVSQQGSLASLNDTSTTFEPVIEYIREHVSEVVYESDAERLANNA